MMSETGLPYDIAVLGLGISGVHQMTKEAEETIKRSSQVFITDMASGVKDYLTTLGPTVTNLYTEYTAASHRILIYRRMASVVVSAAIDNPPVCFATYGHPKMYTYPTTLIERAARLLDLKVTILPGVSSLDTLLVDLDLDPAMDGLQVYEATDVIVRNRPIQPDVPCVVLQAAIALDPYNRPGQPSDDGVRLLQEHMLKYYPADHRATLLISRIHPLLDPVQVSFPIAQLADAVTRTSNVATLMIPPVRTRPVADDALAQRMRLPAQPSRIEP
ncbi:MAG: SAM-dependent methyltransferase, partial [Isosphaeraceae bacterium]